MSGRYCRVFGVAFVGLLGLLGCAAGGARPDMVDSPARTFGGYYAAVDATGPTALRTTLHELIDDHLRFPYTGDEIDVWDIVEEADEDPTDPNRVLDIYRNASYAKATTGNEDYQREHAWPKSYGFKKNVVANYPFTDCHHLFVADGSYNGSRGNKPYRACDPAVNSACREKPTEFRHGRGGGGGGYPGEANWTAGAHETGAWETWMGRRGDVARAMFYMDVRYEGGTHGVTGQAEPDLILTDKAGEIVSSQANLPVARMGMRSVLLKWHRDDPVDDIERRRNEVVFSYQGNRNPFIDHPEWVACVFEGMCE